MTRVTALLVYAAVVGCGDDDRAPEPTPEPERPEPVLESDPVGEPDPLEGIDDPVDPSEIADGPGAGPIAGAATLDSVAPDRGCVALTRTPVRVWSRPGPATIAAVGRRFVVAGYAPRGTSSGEQLFLVTLSPETAPRPLRTVSIDPPHRHVRAAPPGLAVLDDARVAVAMTDGAARVLAGAVSTSPTEVQPLSLSQVGEGADMRFAPAVAKLARRTAVAWTTRGDTMRVSLAIVDPDGTLVATHRVTPTSMGGAAPVFAAGSGPAWLLFLDARAGVSPIVGVEVAADGTPAEARVARPIGTAASPPEIAVARVGTRVFAGYTAVGDGATTAVGVVRADDEAQRPPAALVPGTGYGVLNVSVAAGRRAAVFAADAPRDAPPGSPRELFVRIADDEGPGPELVVRGPDETARHASIARRSDGILGVSFESAGAVHVAWLRCDD